MSPEAPNSPSRPPHWLLRRADQAAVAGAVLLALGATVAWWASHGRWQGRLLELQKAESQTAQFQVDVNTAELPELLHLPGVGPTLAERILESRQKDGPFRNPDDLRRRVRGIGPKTFQRLRPYLRPSVEADRAAEE